jgi:beta-lactam-binding protein with PASTA domain
MAFVFAKEQLQDLGFAWRVRGRVHGYAANTVVTQSPAPGTRLVSTGAPLIVVGLKRNKSYRESGQPEDTSPYAPTADRQADLTGAASP